MIKTIFQVLGIAMKLHAIKNWKTTVWGLIGAILMVIYDQLTRGVTDNRTIILACIPAVAGFLSKDATVSGGTQEVVLEQDDGKVKTVSYNKNPAKPEAVCTQMAACDDPTGLSRQSQDMTQ